MIIKTFYPKGACKDEYFLFIKSQANKGAYKNIVFVKRPV